MRHCLTRRRGGRVVASWFSPISCQANRGTCSLGVLGGDDDLGRDRPERRSTAQGGLRSVPVRPLREPRPADSHSDRNSRTLRACHLGGAHCRPAQRRRRSVRLHQVVQVRDTLHGYANRLGRMAEFDTPVFAELDSGPIQPVALD